MSSTRAERIFEQHGSWVGGAGALAKCIASFAEVKTTAAVSPDPGTAH
jgi:hypothetical protein